jgi:hypothetical protein
MSKSPLENSFNSKSKERSKPILILALLGILGLGGGVLATQIQINFGNDETVEFGQGAADVITCDRYIEIYPTSVYVPTTEVFKLANIEIRKLDTTTTEVDPDTGIAAPDSGCGTKVLTVKALGGDYGEEELRVWTTVVPTSASTSATLTLSPSPSQTINSQSIVDITIESSDNLS